MIDLPDFIDVRIQGRKNLQRILSNVAWLLLDRVLKIAAGVFVGIWLARYLGPERFGQMSYALAFVMLCSPIAMLGLKNIVVRDIVREPDQAKTILGTALGLQVAGSLVAVALLVGIISAIRPGDELMKIMIAILGVRLVVQSSRVITYWFEAEVQSRYSVWAENAAIAVSSALKIALILLEAPLIAFVWVLLIEAIISALASFAFYARKAGSAWDWNFRLERARSMLGASWPLILSGLSLMLYMKIDQVMLGQMASNHAVGIYAAALRLSEVWYMIPTIAAASLFPTILKTKATDEQLYIRRMQDFLNFLAVVSVGLAILVSFFATDLIVLLYGRPYAEAGPVLLVHVWSCPFIFIGLAGTRWLLAEGLQRFNFYRNLAGAVVNVAMNLVLIPLYGAWGAAIATLVSYAVANYAMDVLSPLTRQLFTMKSKALFANDFAFLKRR